VHPARPVVSIVSAISIVAVFIFSIAPLKIVFVHLHEVHREVD